MVFTVTAKQFMGAGEPKLPARARMKPRSYRARIYQTPHKDPKHATGARPVVPDLENSTRY